MDQTIKENNSEKRILNDADMVKGIGRKATDEELMEYLANNNEETISIDVGFIKFIDDND